MDSEIESFKSKAARSNPFYDNHLFTEKDLYRVPFNKWSWLWLWIFPTLVQINHGYVFYYKIVNGAYWFIKAKPLSPFNSNDEKRLFNR